MRELILAKLNQFVADGATLFLDFDETIEVDPASLSSLSDRELLDIFENTISFKG